MTSLHFRFNYDDGNSNNYGQDSKTIFICYVLGILERKGLCKEAMCNVDGRLIDPSPAGKNSIHDLLNKTVRDKVK